MLPLNLMWLIEEKTLHELKWGRKKGPGWQEVGTVGKCAFKRIGTGVRGKRGNSSCIELRMKRG